MLVALWGERYIDVFCRICLPTLLAPNNLPRLAQAHDLELVLLTRSGEAHRITTYPAFHRLLAVAPVAFVDIDDILTSTFDPAADNYGMALTYAFFRGIQSYGAATLEMAFILWNGDFAAADGTFATVAEAITEGVRCTLAISLRVDSAIEDALAARLQRDPTCLAVPPRELLALAMQFLHPTVAARMVNCFEERGISHPNQFYWRIDDGLIVARSFIWFPLQLQPETVPEAIDGFCDYAFAPELVPSGEHRYETRSDRVLIIEIQHGEKVWEEVLAAEQPMTPEAVAPGLGYWTTHEHVAASRQLLVFNSADPPPDLDPARRQTDEFMNAVYRLLPRTPQWHNGHVYWRECHERAGLAYDPPGPGAARSRLAAALRWTGHDLDVPREGWPDPPEPLAGLLQDPPELASPGDAEGWLERLYALCFEAWLLGDGVEVIEAATIDLVSPGFRGFGWGIPVRSAEAWVRPLGPDGRAVLLLRVPPQSRVRLRLHGARRGDAALEELRIAVNGLAAEPEIGRCEPEPGFTLSVDVDAAAAALRGCLMVLLREPARGPAGDADFAFAAVTVETIASCTVGANPTG